LKSVCIIVSVAAKGGDGAGGKNGESIIAVDINKALSFYEEKKPFRRRKL